MLTSQKHRAWHSVVSQEVAGVALSVRLAWSGLSAPRQRGGEWAPPATSLPSDSSSWGFWLPGLSPGSLGRSRSSETFPDLPKETGRASFRVDKASDLCTEACVDLLPHLFLTVLCGGAGAFPSSLSKNSVTSRHSRDPFGGGRERGLRVYGLLSGAQLWCFYVVFFAMILIVFSCSCHPT